MTFDINYSKSPIATTLLKLQNNNNNNNKGNIKKIYSIIYHMEKYPH